MLHLNHLEAISVSSTTEHWPVWLHVRRWTAALSEHGILSSIWQTAPASRQAAASVASLRRDACSVPGHLGIRRMCMNVVQPREVTVHQYSTVGCTEARWVRWMDWGEDRRMDGKINKRSHTTVDDQWDQRGRPHAAWRVSSCAVRIALDSREERTFMTDHHQWIKKSRYRASSRSN